MVALKKFIQTVHRLFDPRLPVKHDTTFTLKQPPSGQQPGDAVIVKAGPPKPPTYPEELRLTAHAVQDQVDEVLTRLQGDIEPDAALTLARLKDQLRLEQTSGVQIRSFTIPLPRPVRAHVVCLETVTDAMEIQHFLIDPLLNLPRVGAPAATGLDLLALARESLVPSRHVLPAYTLTEAADGVSSGLTVLLLDTVPGVLLVEARQWPTRAVSEPRTESVIRGPHEGFTESLQINMALVRRRLMTPKLVMEPGRVGTRTRADLVIAYLDGVVNPTLVDEVRRRISHVDIDALGDSGQLEQLIRDNPLSFFPTMISTERPDRAAAYIAEGRVVIMVQGSPFAIMAPTTFGDFLRNPEDYYIAWPFATLLRIIRAFGMMITLLLPALYIAIADYHQEMIPSTLLLAIAASREAVPFPAPLEVILMEVAFEIIREGSLRVPTILGQTIGIVGALILGQAAVEASIVSPILVIIVATTALGSFTISNLSMSLAIRTLRFVFIFLGAGFGLYGIAAGLFFLTAHAASLKSFGVPYMAPIGPRSPAGPDGLTRGPQTLLDQRPAMLQTRDIRRQGKGITAWNAPTYPEAPGGKSNG